MSAVITANDLSFELSNGRILFSNLNFSLNHNITALVGPNGVGKTCLAEILSGEREPTTGAIRKKTSVGRFRQSEAPDPITVEKYLARKGWKARPGGGEILLSGINSQALCTNLSGGEWARVRLASLPTDGFVILDEPSNDLDRVGRKALLDFLREHRAGALLISHDRECLNLCSEVFELSNRGLAKFGTGWKEYEEAKTFERAQLGKNLDSAKRSRDQAHADRTEQMAKQTRRSQKGASNAAKGSLPNILLGRRKRQAQVTSGAVNASTLQKTKEAVGSAHDALAEMKIEAVMYADLIGHSIPT